MKLDAPLCQLSKRERLFDKVDKVSEQGIFSWLGYCKRGKTLLSTYQKNEKYKITQDTVSRDAGSKSTPPLSNKMLTMILKLTISVCLIILMLKVVTGKGPINIFLMARSGLHMLLSVSLDFYHVG